MVGKIKEIKRLINTVAGHERLLSQSKGRSKILQNYSLKSICKEIEVTFFKLKGPVAHFLSSKNSLISYLSFDS